MLASLLARMADGDAEACLLEESRSKLLFGPVPRKMNVRVELAKRLQLWRQGKYLELLIRAEEQYRLRLRSFEQRPVGLDSRSKRARALIAEGAYSKAAASLHTERADLNDAEQDFVPEGIICAKHPAPLVL